MSSKSIISIAFIAFVMVSCEVEEYPAKALPPFRSISSNGYVTFKLVNGAENQVISTSLADINYSVSGRTLSVNAAGGTMTIAVRNLYSLWCNACRVESDGLVTDTLYFSIHGGSLKLYNAHVNNYLGLSAQNLGRYRFSGFASFFHFSTTNLASVEAYNLETDSTYVNSTSITDAEVNASQVLNVFINSVGGVNYKGNPPVVRATITGMGRLVKK